MNSDDVLRVARSCLETPFQHQGRIPGLALDCAGLVVHVARTLGFDYIDSTSYGRTPCNGLLESAMDSQPCLVRVMDVRKAGDVLLMRFAGDPQHLAILTENDTIIHSYYDVEKVAEHNLTDKWERRIIRTYRFKDLA